LRLLFEGVSPLENKLSRLGALPKDDELEGVADARVTSEEGDCAGEETIVAGTVGDDISFNSSVLTSAIDGLAALRANR
jgi:hypothetical protein